MNVLFYSTKMDSAVERLKKAVESVISKEELEIHHFFDSLSTRLQQPMNGLEIAILLAGSDQDLADFISLHDLLSELRIILILPDRKPSTFAKGHKLGPRYMTYTDSDFQDVKAVLSKMIDGQGSRCNR